LPQRLIIFADVAPSPTARGQPGTLHASFQRQRVQCFTGGHVLAQLPQSRLKAMVADGLGEMVTGAPHIALKPLSIEAQFGLKFAHVCPFAT
jgi:hypothetical protein